MTWEDLKAYLDKTGTSEDARIEACWDIAGELLTLATAKAFRVIPQSILDDMQLKVGKGLFDSKSTTNNNSQMTTFESAVIARAARDPLAEVKPILAMYVVRY